MSPSRKDKRTALKSPFGFTLAELIVVITVLAILATVGFVMLSGHLSSARDSSRITEVGQISRSVELSAVQNGKYPMPVAAEGVILTSFTGGVSGNVLVTQWAATAANVRDLGGTFGKKKQTGPFTYSVLGDGAAYQVAAEFENGVSAAFPSPFGIRETYALSKTAYVEGTYKSDPSLPSLIVSSGSVTGTWLFSPDACFVTHGGANLPSTSAGCVPKKSFALKSIDSWLVGYWDMETLCVSGSCGAGNDGKLADLSGNWGNWTLSGTFLVNGLAGKARSFTWGGIVNQVEVPNSSAIDIGGTGSVVSFEAVFKANSLASTWQNVVFKWSLPDDCALGCSSRQYGAWINGSGSVHLVATSTNRIGTGQTVWNSTKWSVVTDKEYLLSSVIDGRSGTMKIYLNGILQSSVPFDPSGTRNSTGSLLFWANHGNYALDGTLDEIKIFNRPLSKDEILQHAKILWF